MGGIIGWKLELGEVGPNTGGEPNAGGRKADIQEDSLGGGLELNDDRRLSTSHQHLLISYQTFHSEFFPVTAVIISFSGGTVAT